MRIRVALPKADADKLRAKIVESAEKVETEESPADEWEAVSWSRLRHSIFDAYLCADDAHRAEPIPRHQRDLAEGMQGPWTDRNANVRCYGDQLEISGTAFATSVVSCTLE